MFFNTKIQHTKKIIIIATSVAWKWTVRILVGATLFGLSWYGGMLIERCQHNQVQATIVAAERAEAYGQLGAEVHMLGQLLVAEIGAYPEEWDEVVESVLGRVESDLFPNTLEGVVKQTGRTHFQFVGMGDNVPDMMVTDQGLAAIAFAEQALRSYYAGTFEFTLNGVHSFCVPSACEAASAYFGQFALLAEREGHDYYGGDRMSVSSYAPTTSIRPGVRPSSFGQSVVLAEQVEEQILRAVQVALSE